MVKTLDITELQQLVEKLPEIGTAASILKKIDVLSVKGLHGSSRAMFSSALFNKNQGTYLFILNDAESAGYFYHDLTQVMGSGEVFFSRLLIKELQNLVRLMRLTKFCVQRL